MITTTRERCSCIYSVLLSLPPPRPRPSSCRVRSLSSMVDKTYSDLYEMKFPATTLALLASVRAARTSRLNGSLRSTKQVCMNA